MTSNLRSSPHETDHPAVPPWRVRSVPWLIAIITPVLGLAYRLVDIPLNRLFEQHICRSYYQAHDPSRLRPDGDVPERFCKENYIQERLVFYIGLITTLELGIEILISIPMGFVSDKRGRRLTLFLNMGASILAKCWYIAVGYSHKAPISSAVAGVVFHLWGGGVNVASAALNACIADVADDDAHLTKLLAYTTMPGQAFQLVAPVVSSSTMKINLAIPVVLGLVCHVLIIVLVGILPNTRTIRDDSRTPPKRIIGADAIETGNETENDPLLTGHTATSNLGEGDESSTTPGDTRDAAVKSPIQRALWQYRQQVRYIKDLFFKSSASSLCLLIVFCTTFGRTVQNILLLYASKRYKMSIADAGYLFTIKGAVNILLLAVVIPNGLALCIKRWKWTACHANLTLLSISNALQLLGGLAISFSPTLSLLIASLIFYSFGYGYSLFTISIITDLTSKSMGKGHIARAYAAMSMVETVALLSAVPAYTATWLAGLEIGGVGYGLPWWLCSAFYTMSAVAIFQLSRTSQMKDE